MEEPMKKTTIRFEVEVADKIEQLGNLAAIVTHFTDTYYHVRASFAQWIKQGFTKNELKLILDADNGLTYSVQLIAGYPAHLEDAITIDGLDTKWGVDSKAFMAKINGLEKHELMMLHEWSHWFWYGKWHKQPDLEEYVR
jgi:hypothetical protein